LRFVRDTNLQLESNANWGASKESVHAGRGVSQTYVAC
jgi:hypothetical protein